MTLKLTRAALALAAAGAAATATAALPAITHDTLEKMAPPQRQAVLKRLAKTQAAVRTVQTAGEIDATAPVLLSVDAGPAVDVSLADNPLSATFRAADDMSGVREGYVWAYGPSGQYVDVHFYNNLPAKKLNGKMASSGLTAFLQPGAYAFGGAYLYDYAGNVSVYDQDALAALGKSTFTVKNKRGYDVAPPSLTAGKILTPHVSLSAKVPGTELAPIVGVSITATDAGSTAVSGLRYASAGFCLADQSSCFYAGNSSMESQPRQANATFRLGGQLDPVWHTPGEYHLQSVTVVDYAGNFQYLLGTEFGGDYDFSQTFPSTVVQLVP